MDSTSQAFLQDYLGNNLGGQNSLFRSEVPLKVGNYDGYYVTFTAEVSGQTSGYYVQYKGKIWEFVFDSASREMVDQIVTSLVLT